MIFHVDTIQNKTGVAILASEKVEFRKRNGTRYKRDIHNDRRINY